MTDPWGPMRRVMNLLMLAACARGGEVLPPSPVLPSAIDSGGLDSEGARPGDPSALGPCPIEMALVGGVCIDRWEAHLAGQSPYEVPVSGSAVSTPDIPQGYISGRVAAAACAEAGKRLCRSEEWLDACRGDSRVYPYGDTFEPGRCNIRRDAHPVVELFGAAADWSPGQMNDPRLNQLPDGLARSGAYEGCMTPDGVFDLHGNLHEWVDDPSGVFRGGFYVDAEINGDGCSYVTTAHSPGYHDYSTGFRCCRDADDGP